MSNLRFEQRPNSTPVTIIGRVANPSGQICDRVFEGTIDLKAIDSSEIQRLIQRPSDLAKNFLGRSERPLAFVGIGFGAAPTSASDRLLWKGEFNEAEHPRVGPGTPKGGEFRSADVGIIK